MKVAITGHLSGLGKSLYKKIPNSVGIDKLEGNDISKPNDWIDRALCCDVLINNAYKGFEQCNILEIFFKNWKNENKTIINVSSCAANINTLYKENFFYPIHKKALDDACIRLQQIQSNVRIVNIKIGWMDTPMSKDFDQYKLNPDYVADVIINCLQNKDIYSITIGDIGNWKI